MKHFLAIVCALLIAVPAPAAAQALTLTDLLKEQPALEFVPKPVTADCVEGSKCLDFDNFKLYLLMRTQYVWLFKVHTQLVPAIQEELKNSARSFAKAERIQGARASRAEEAYDDLFPKYEKSVLKEERAKALSVFGGGFPWLVVALVTGIAGGIYLGTLIPK